MTIAFCLVLIVGVLEAMTLLLLKRSWLSMMVKEFLDMLVHSAKEIVSKETNKVICSIMFFCCVLTMLMPVVYGFVIIVGTEGAGEKLPHCIQMSLVCFLVTFLQAWLNKRYVARD